MRTILAAVFALALPIAASAQNAVPSVECAAITTTQPCLATLEWDPVAATPTSPVTGYRCYLDGTLAATAQGQTTTSCVLTVPAIGRHAAGVSSFNQTKESAQAPLLFDAILVSEAPAVPGNLRIRITVTPTGEQAAPFTAFGHAWTLKGTDPQMDGQHAGNAGASGDQLILLASGIYLHASDNNWYRWNGVNDWTLQGPTRPPQ